MIESDYHVLYILSWFFPTVDFFFLTWVFPIFLDGCVQQGFRIFTW